MSKPTSNGAFNPTSQDWLVFSLIILFGGTSFSGIRIAVETAPPSIVGAGRLWVGAIILFAYLFATGRKPLSVKSPEGGLNPIWKYAFGAGLIGYAIPMALFPFAQQTVSSLLAGIYMAVMPVVAVVLAALFVNEPLTRQKLTGFGIGTIGVIILIGPYALLNIFSDDVIAQGALLVSITGYAICTIIMRKAPEVPARSFAAGIMLMGALCLTPFALADISSLTSISLRSWLGIIYLGTLPTGIAAILIVTLVRRVGVGFMAMGNYLTPLVGVACGMLLFGEHFKIQYAIGLSIIFIGVSIAQPGPMNALKTMIKRKLS